MQSPIYFTILVVAVCGLWFVWDLGIRKLFLAGFRERLFELRFRLFEVAASGEIDFDDEAYRAIETLICGLLRFADRITLMSYVFSVREQTRAKEAKEYVDYHQQIELKVSRTPQAAQENLRSILEKTQSAVVMFMFVSSFICIAAGLTFSVLKWMKLGPLASKREMSAVLESQIYSEEIRDRGFAAA